MRKISISVGVIGLLVVGWFLVQGSSVDYVATVDDELTKLELELAALDGMTMSDDEVSAAKDTIANRLGTINASLVASQDRALKPAQQQMLESGLVRLQQLLSEHQTTLTALDQSGAPENATSDGPTIIALTQTITKISGYLEVPVQGVADSPQNAAYVIDGMLVQLTDGSSVVEAALGSAELITTTYFGNEVSVDVNNDGRSDTVSLLTQTTGGSGTFFYVVAAINTEQGWVGSNGFLLGDRIEPQTTELSQNPEHQNVLVINYLTQDENQTLTDQPSVGTSVWLKLDPDTMMWGEVAQDFAGAADPDTMTLGMKPWTWVRTTYNDGAQLVPNQAGDFAITFASDNTVSIATDCNVMNGNYEVDADQITFGPLLATEMFCEDSAEQDFANMLGQVQSYFFTIKGELVFELKFDSGSSVFR